MGPLKVFTWPTYSGEKNELTGSVVARVMLALIELMGIGRQGERWEKAARSYLEPVSNVKKVGCKAAGAWVRVISADIRLGTSLN